jgi:hypothetical protein
MVVSELLLLQKNEQQNNINPNICKKLYVGVKFAEIKGKSYPCVNGKALPLHAITTIT